SRDERVKISREALRARMRTEFNYSEDAMLKEQLLSNADSILANKFLVPGLQAKTLFTMQGKPYSVKDFLNFLGDQPAGQPGMAARQRLGDEFTHYVDRIQNELLEKRVISQSPDHKWLLQEYYEGILLFE